MAEEGLGGMYNSKTYKRTKGWLNYWINDLNLEIMQTNAKITQMLRYESQGRMFVKDDFRREAE